MAHGGVRPGAGRPKGSKNRATLKSALKYAQLSSDQDIMPLDVMLDVMKRHYRAQEWDKAHACAKDAAPYLHARLQAIEHGGPDNKPIPLRLEALTDAQLDVIIARLQANLARGPAEGTPETLPPGSNPCS